MDGDHLVELVQVELGDAAAAASAKGGDRAQVGLVVEHRLHVVPGAEGNQVGVVRRRRDRHGTRATNVRVAQLVSET